MHEVQHSLLQTIQERGLKILPPLRKLAELTGKSLSAQQVKHHLQQLEKKGFILIKKDTGEIKISTNSNIISTKSAFITLPIYGVANCGPALSLVQGAPEGFLKLSTSLLKNKNFKDLFVVKASGNSMNTAEVNGKKIEDGDYLVIDTSKTNLVKGIGEIVLSVIDGAANIKRIFKKHDHIVLVSDSKDDYPPIYIDKSSDFIVNGLVADVMKKHIQ